MRRPGTLRLLLVGALAGALGSCSTTGPERSTSTSTTTSSSSSASTSSASTATPSTDPVQACVQELTEDLDADERVGQLFMVGLGSSADPVIVDQLVRDRQVGGVILLGGWSGSSTIRAATDRLGGLAGRPGLFLAADQEGGQVQQLKGAGFSVIPSAQQQATLGAALTAQARAWGEELVQAGINLNLAPVADTVPASLGTGNGPIGRYHREYGSTPEAVIPPMTAFLTGMHEAGVMTAVKHFPGIGRITGNTDTAASGITDDVATTNDPSLQPFAAGIEAGTEFVMVSSAFYPKIAAAQALFAPEIVTELLRGQLDFGGVVVTDDVGAAAALQAVPVPDRATGFIAAGGDLVLTASTEDISPMFKAVSARIGDDPAFAAQAQAALERILTLKARRGLADCG